MMDAPAATVSLAACPICGETSYSVLGERSDGIEVLQCQRCRMGRVAKRPLDTSVYYSDSYYSGDEASEAGYSDYAMVAAHSLAWAGELIRLLSPGGKILKVLKVLDVGCADGHLLQQLGPAYEPYGIEVNEHLRERCERAGIRMLGADICDESLAAEYGGFFDVIAAIAVLEHVPDIRAALDRIRSLLAPEGVLLFEVPLLSPTRDNRIWFTSSLEHVYYPTPEGLAFLFKDVFKLPLIGREVAIQGYGSTFVGLATRSAARHRELAELFQRLLDAPVAALASRQERSFRFSFDVVHAAVSTPETVALLADLDPASVTPELLHRLATLWGLDLSRDASLEPVETYGTSVESVRRAVAVRDARLGEMQAELAERDRALLAASREMERQHDDLHAIYSSKSWRMVVRVWNLRIALRRRLQGRSLGAGAWRAARFGYRLLPLSGSARFRLRGRVLAWLSVADDAPPEAAVSRLRDLSRKLTWRRAGSAAALLLRGDLAALKLHLRQIVQHTVNEETRQALSETPAELVLRRQEPWPASLPLVSVVIPCYNYGRFVAEAVDSVLAQTFRDFEILVVDGGSSADSLATLRELSRPQTQVYFREGGRHLVGDNRNFGISRARGKYVCCLDADDLIRPTYLEKALFLLETQDYDLVSTAIRSFGDKSEIFHLERFPGLADMLTGNHVSTCAVFRKELWVQAGGFQDTGIGGNYFYEDWRLWVRFSALGARFANIVDECLFLYRVHSSYSLSNQNQGVPAMDRQREAVREFNQDVIDDEALSRSEEHRRIKVGMQDGFVNLKRGWPAATGEATILIAMPFLIIGGAERLLSEIVVHLGSRGFRIVLVTTEYVYPIYGDATPWFEKTTAEIYQLPRFLEPNRWQEFIDYLLETRNVSLLWIVGSRVLYELLPRIEAAHPDLKVIDLLFNTVGHTANNRKFTACFDRILVENREVEEWLLAAGEPPEKIVQIPSGVDLGAFRPQPDRMHVLGELGIEPGAFIAGFSGRLAEEKDPEAFLEIARRCRRDSRFVFLMTGAGPLTDVVRRRIEKLALGDALRFLGQVEKVSDIMAAYDVLILPSRFDGRPIAVLESLALGVPVIASRVGALPELIQDGVTGFLCEPGDTAAFAERIRWLAAHPDEHRHMKTAARAFAEAELDARRMFERYEEAIRGVLDGC